MIRIAPKFILPALLLLVLPLPGQDKFPPQPVTHPLKKAAADPFSPNPIDVLHYDIRIELEPSIRRLTGAAELLIRRTSPSDTRFYLNLIDLSVDSVTIDSSKSSFERTSTHILLKMPANADTFSVTVYYRGNPGNDGSGGFFWGSDIIWTAGEGLSSDPPSTLRYWIPSNDQPADKATLDLAVTVPNNLQVVSNGDLVSTSENPDFQTRTFHWRESHPIASYLIAISVSDFAYFNDRQISVSGDTIPLHYYVRPDLLDKAKEDWKDTGKMLAFFESVFGPYPFDSYGMVSVPMRGAMEHQTMTSYGTGLITGDHRYDYIVAHELAHMWWGDLVTLGDWRDLWLNEGFATYSEALWFESIGDGKTLGNYMSRLKDIYLNEVSRIGHFAIYDPQYLWGGTIYQKGGWVLHMLRWTVGDSTFFEILQEYGRRFAYGNALTSDFQTVAEEIYGRDLEWFFDQWIYSPGFPELQVGWDYSRPEPDRFEISLSITQKQTVGTVFTLPLEIQIKTEAGNVLDTLMLSERQQSFQLTTSTVPAEIEIDPNNWLLKRVEIVSRPLPQGFSPNDFELAQNYPNPFIAGRNGNQTRILLQIGMKNAPFDVRVTVFNLLGQRVKTLIDKPMLGGLYTLSWDGRDEQGRPVPTGTYLYQLNSGKTVITKQLSLLRD